MRGLFGAKDERSEPLFDQLGIKGSVNVDDRERFGSSQLECA